MLITRAIAASADDGEIYGLSTGFDNILTNAGFGESGGDPYYPFLRFQNILIPSGAKISSAILTLTAFTTYTDTPAVTTRIYGDKQLSSPVITSYADMAGRTKTTAYIDFTQGNTTANSTYSTTDLSTIIQEIINQPGWSSGNNLQLFLWYYAGMTRFRNYYTYDSGESAKYPSLAINYTVSSGDPVFLSDYGVML